MSTVVPQERRQPTPLTGDRVTLLQRQLRLDADRLSLRGGGRRLWRKHLRRLGGGPAAVAKRTIDASVAALLLLLLSPLLLFIAAAIRLTDGGQVLFWQRRVGRWGREFDFPKFRSMCVDAEAKKAALLAQNDHADGVTFKMKRDPRVTRVGRWLRRLSLDELPQLWCVLKGEMSLVGPRPPVPSEVARYTLADRRRLDAVPGLTCIWQVAGRGTIPFPEQVTMDVRYIETQSLRGDLRLLIRTVPAVIGGRGAY